MLMLIRRYQLSTSGVATMDYDDKSIEEAVLALLAAFSSDDGNAWKGFDFES